MVRRKRWPPHDWRDIWLNEGFATYAEWLWAEHEGRAPAQAVRRGMTPSRRQPFWTDGDRRPRPRAPVRLAVYDRGAMTLHALRLLSATRAFFRILQQWASENAGGNGAHRAIHRPGRAGRRHAAGRLFNTWLFKRSEALADVEQRLSGCRPGLDRGVGVRSASSSGKR